MAYSGHLGPIVRLLERMTVLPVASAARSSALLTFLVVALLGQFYDLYVHHDTIVDITRRLSTLNQTGLCTVKVFVIFANRHRIRELLYSVNNNFGAEGHRYKASHALLLRLCDRRALTLTLVYMALLSVSLSLPVLSVAMHPHEFVVLESESEGGNATGAGAWRRRLPFRISYPLDTQRSGALYALVLALHLGVAVCFTLLPPTCDGFFVGLMGHAAAQLQVLQAWLRQAGGGEEDEGEEEEEERARMRRCLRHHRAVLRFVKELDALMQPILFLQFAASVGCYGTGVVYIVAAPPETAILAGIMIAALLQLGMICYFGDNVKEQSLAVAQAAYCGRWYRSPRDVQNALRLVTLRSQRATTLSIAGVLEVSLATYAEVLRLSYTFFAMIREVSN